MMFLLRRKKEKANLRKDEEEGNVTWIVECLDRFCLIFDRDGFSEDLASADTKGSSDLQGWTLIGARWRFGTIEKKTSLR